MQCESVANPAEPSPGAPPAYSVRSPASPGTGPAAAGVAGVSPAGGPRTPTPAETEARERWRVAAPRALYGSDASRARSLLEQHQHRVRLLQMQQSQHIMVPPEVTVSNSYISLTTNYTIAEKIRSRSSLLIYFTFFYLSFFKFTVSFSQASEQPQADLGTALVSVTAPPNVTLTRTDYHLYHHSEYSATVYAPRNLTNKNILQNYNPMRFSTDQMSGNYGTNKITTSQQNPMLSRQLSVSSVDMSF